MQSSSTPERPPFVFPHASSPCYIIAPDAKYTDLYDLLNAKLLHLEAMLATTHGELGERFRYLSTTLQDNFLWGCASLARECQMLLEQTEPKYDARANTRGAITGVTE